MIMEVMDLVTSGTPEEDNFEVDDDNIDNATFEGERCGICMDIIIDRGVLDCCQHWFCFACIDNWATITNLCPLCQNEFQLITCVPVYDTIGSNKVEEESFSRDDDWCVEGRNNTLSFPSYYIDENAVICLDGDGCKIRSGSLNVEGDSNLDTSIACDSCDIWYHAFCVGFDSEATTESTWLCPRCVPQKSGAISTQKPENKSGPENANHECFIDDAFSGKVSVSVADAGETAVVVSMVGEDQRTEKPNENILSTILHENDTKTETDMSISDASSHKVGAPSTEKATIQPIFAGKELELSLSHDTSFILPSNSLVLTELKTSPTDEAKHDQNSLHGIVSTSAMLISDSCVGNRQSENESIIGLHLGLSSGAFLSVDDIKNDVSEDLATEDVQQQNPSAESMAKVDKFEPDANEDAIRVVGVKRRPAHCSEHMSMDTDDGDSKPKIATEVSRKKIRAEGRIQQIHTEDKADELESDNTKKCPTPVAVPKDDKFHHEDQEDLTSNILSIVRGTKHRPSKGLAHSNLADKSSIEQENTAGLRVKKIMRRAAKDKESSMVVQSLTKEIREAVRDRSSTDFGESLFDPKLLAAFRTAVAGPQSEPVKKSSSLAIKAKKSILQKGKVRENLTKKIYGSSNGKRKRAWDRDCEVEFWKHRCMRATKPEKIQTLKSVLGLLKKTLDSSDEGTQSQAKNPILSRLYLADTSVFPRKDNIKPLSALKASGNSEQNKELHTSAETCPKASMETGAAKFTDSNKDLLKAGVPSLEIKENENNIPISKRHVASAPTKVRSSTHSEGPCTSALGDSKTKALKQLDVKSDYVKSDKRKWAIEVLARKTAVTSKDARDESQGDNTVLKGNYPLLAQLPADMRPVPATSRHNKIPLSVRQTQLYRLTEHFLKKANLPVIRRTAETELAVADAINIEKEVADRSNSKVVYLNLCSQEILHHSNNSKSSSTTESNTLPSSEVPVDGSEQTNSEPSTDPVILEALKTAGLLSDSPPNSPLPERDVLNDNYNYPSVGEGALDNILDVDSHPELDIYGDFEYDLEDEDYIGVTSTKVSKPPPEEVASKMKVVFSTLYPERSNDCVDMKDQKAGNVEAPKDSTSPQNDHDSCIRSTVLEGETDAGVPPEYSVNDNTEEPSIAECEELYGPDKEPLIEKFPEVASGKWYGQVDAATLVENKEAKEDENYSSNNMAKSSDIGSKSNADNIFVAAVVDSSPGFEHPRNLLQTGENVASKDLKSGTQTSKQNDSFNHVFKKVEAYIKEHIRPLCKSGVITAEQYRWAVAKTTDKVMKYHGKAKNANFLIKEGEKVKKLAEQYVEASRKEKSDSL